MLKELKMTTGSRDSLVAFLKCTSVSKFLHRRSPDNTDLIAWIDMTHLTRAVAESLAPSPESSPESQAPSPESSLESEAPSPSRVPSRLSRVPSRVSLRNVVLASMKLILDNMESWNLKLFCLHD